MHKKLNTQMNLLGEYILIPKLDSGQQEWLKLELYLDADKKSIYPNLYARDEFLLTNQDDSDQSPKILWFQECGWFLPWDICIRTTSESEALHIIEKYINCRMQGEEIPKNITELIQEYSL